MARHRWEPDVLGAHFEQLTLPLGSDNEGDLVATLVRYVPPPRIEFARPVAAGTNVLYVLGWSDYFFQRQLAEFWHRAGARFFALDLRKYGRSLRPGQTPGFITDLATYDEDIGAALDAMDAAKRPLILMGHSTGGLTLSLWAERNPGAASALVLNSPWLEFQARGARNALAPLVSLRARVDPRGRMPQPDLGFYARSTSSSLDGAWDYDLAWRPERGFAVHPAWLSAILAGHARVAAGLSIDVPVLTMLSARSTILPYWKPEMMHSDIVLKVDDIARASLNLGATVTVARIEGALHDIFLSEPTVRAEAYTQLTHWLRGYVSAGTGGRRLLSVTL
jgi:alpha-beta hydrolase superfamily lysophospholipase